MPARCISAATVTISSSDGVIRPRQPDHVGIVVVGGLQDRRPRDHDAKVDDLEIIALEDDADDVLADVVNVALDRRHDDPALRRRAFGLLRLDVGEQVGDGLLHHARRLDDLRQEHLAGAKQVADDVHPGHQRPFNDIDRAGCGQAGFFRVVDNISVQAFDKGVFEPLVDRPAAPFLGGLFRRDAALEPVGHIDQPFGVGDARSRRAVEDDVLACVAQLRIDRNASSARRIYGCCCTRSGGVSTRFALYPPYSITSNCCVLMLNFCTSFICAAISLRCTGAPTSYTAARYSGAKSFRNLLIMFTNTYVAAVGIPVRVDIGRDRCIAWYARKINAIESNKYIGGFPPGSPLSRPSARARATAAALAASATLVMPESTRSPRFAAAFFTVAIPSRMTPPGQTASPRLRPTHLKLNTETPHPNAHTDTERSRMSLTPTTFMNLPDCLQLSNGSVDLVLTTTVGPRILFFGPTGGPNLLGLFPDASKETSLGTWRPYGGHRLWVAPELVPATYAPDNSPIEVTTNGDLALTLRQPTDAAGFAKQISLTLAPTGSLVTLTQTITSHNLWPVRVAPWAVSIVAPGTSILPRVPFSSHDDIVAPSQPLALSAYTDLQDPRLTLGLRYLLLHGDPDLPHSQKIGLLVKEGWAAHLVDDLLFLKRFPFDPEDSLATYPDFGVNTEVYTEGRFQELELLGPERTLQPGQSLTLAEDWNLLPIPGASAARRNPDQLHTLITPHLAPLL